MCFRHAPAAGEVLDFGFGVREHPPEDTGEQRATSMRQDMKKAAFGWGVVGDVIISYTANGSLSDVDWKPFIEELKTRPCRRWLAATRGTVEVTSIQRKWATEIMTARSIEAVVITDENLVRGIVTAASWLGAKVTAYPWSKMTDAVAKLGVSTGSISRVVETVDDIARRAT